MSSRKWLSARGRPRPTPDRERSFLFAGRLFLCRLVPGRSRLNPGCVLCSWLIQFFSFCRFTDSGRNSFIHDVRHTGYLDFGRHTVQFLWIDAHFLANPALHIHPFFARALHASANGFYAFLFSLAQVIQQTHLAPPSGFPNWKIPLSRSLMPLGDKWKLLLLENTDLMEKEMECSGERTAYCPCENAIILQELSPCLRV